MKVRKACKWYTYECDTFVKHVLGYSGDITNVREYLKDINYTQKNVKFGSRTQVLWEVT